MANEKKLAQPKTTVGNNHSVKYTDTGLNQSKGFIDGVRNTLFTIRNKKLIEKKYMEKGGKFKEVVIPTTQAASGVLRSIKSDCELKFQAKVSKLTEFDYTSLLKQQNQAFKERYPELYKGKLTDAKIKQVNDLVWQQTMYSIQTNLDAKVKQ